MEIWFEIVFEARHTGGLIGSMQPHQQMENIKHLTGNKFEQNNNAGPLFYKTVEPVNF